MSSRPVDGGPLPLIMTTQYSSGSNREISTATERVNRVAQLLFALSETLCCCNVATVTVKPSYETIVTRWGIPTQLFNRPGIYPMNQCGLEVDEVWQGENIAEISNLLVNDSQGNPLHVTARYSFRVTDSLKARFAFGNCSKFIRQQAISTLLKVAANYPYDSGFAKSKLPQAIL